MRIFNEVSRWYSIPCKILTQVIYVKKKNLNPLKRIRVIIRTPTHGRTDGRTDRQTDGQTDGRTGWIQYTLNFVAGGIISIKHDNTQFAWLSKRHIITGNLCTLIMMYMVTDFVILCNKRKLLNNQKVTSLYFSNDTDFDQMNIV